MVPICWQTHLLEQWFSKCDPRLPGGELGLPGSCALLQTNHKFPFLLIKTFGTFSTNYNPLSAIFLLFCLSRLLGALVAIIIQKSAISQIAHVQILTQGALGKSGLGKGAAGRKSLGTTAQENLILLILNRTAYRIFYKRSNESGLHKKYYHLTHTFRIVQHQIKT